MDSRQQTYMYSNECDLEIHCSPFGLSGLYIKIRGTDIVGIGSTMGRITGSTTGTIHYNNSDDLIDTKYKLYVVIDETGMLRIDFTKIFHEETTKKKDDAPEAGTENATSSSTSNVTSTADPTTTNTAEAKNEKGNKEQEAGQSEDEVPSLIFRGQCPEGHPDKIEPFIGIFSFEREE